MSRRRVIVITACTSRKVSGPPVSAERLYLGEQHRRLMDGVDMLRCVRPVDVWVISAKAGVLEGDEPLASYDETFARLTPSKLRSRAEALGIPERVRALAREPSELTLVLAGNDYFDAACLGDPIDWRARTMALISARSAARIPPHPRLRAVGVGQADARRFSLPLTLLKGEFAKRLLAQVASGVRVSDLMDPRRSIHDHLDPAPPLSATA
jgi:hypothetical protein